MDKTALTGRYTFEFCDGTTCELSLAFIQLKRLSSKNPSLYKRYQSIINSKNPDELEMITVLYAAYICANFDAENLFTEDEFTEKCGTDRFAVRDAMEAMTNPKKRKASVSHSD